MRWIIMIIGMTFFVLACGMAYYEKYHCWIKKGGCKCGWTLVAGMFVGSIVLILIGIYVAKKT